MSKKVMIILTIAILGLFFLKAGITGFVAIGQTCCFPPNCDEENACTLDEIESFSPGRLFTGVIGALMIMILSVYLIHHFKK